jgi:hypothetical protein
VLSDHDREGSEEGSDEDSGKVKGLDGDAPNDDGKDDPPRGFDFLPDEEEDDSNDDSKDDGSLPRPLIEIRSPGLDDDEDKDSMDTAVLIKITTTQLYITHHVMYS